MSRPKEKKEIKIIYQSVQSEPEDIERRLSNAFDFLFEHVIKEKGEDFILKTL
jgi:hypothetical protein